jgi:hypothetical protein
MTGDIVLGRDVPSLIMVGNFSSTGLDFSPIGRFSVVRILSLTRSRNVAIKNATNRQIAIHIR